MCDCPVTGVQFTLIFVSLAMYSDKLFVLKSIAVGVFLARYFQQVFFFWNEFILLMIWLSKDDVWGC